MYKGYFNFLVDGTVGEGDVHSLAPDSDLLRVIYLLYMYMTMSSCSEDGWPVSSCSLWQNGRCCMLSCSISVCLYSGHVQLPTLRKCDQIINNRL